MKLHILIVFAVSIFAYQNVKSQAKTYQQPLTIVTYNDNVNAPFIAAEWAKMQEVYGESLQKEILDRPQRVKDIKNILRNRVEIRQFNNVEVKSCPLLSAVPLFDNYVSNLTRDINFRPKDFNPLKYEFNFYGTGASMYKVDNTNYYIIIKSQHQ